MNHCNNHQYQLHQYRSYWFLPTSLLEAQERFQRWSEQAKHTYVNVKLLSKQKTSENLDRMRNTRSKMVDRGRQGGKHIAARFRVTRLKGQERYQSFKLRRKQQYQSFKHRRQEQYQKFQQRPWILRKKQQYQNFKLNRQAQFVNWNSQFQNQPWMIRTKQVLVDEYTKPEWFDPNDGRPLVAKDITGRFVNPWKSQSTNGVQSLSTILRWRLERIVRQIREVLGYATTSATPLTFLSPPPPLPSLSSLGIFPNNADNDDNQEFTWYNMNNNNSKIQFSWIGHSTCYMQMNGLSILTDPMFSDRAGPYQHFPPIGPIRALPPSHTIKEIVHGLPNGKIDLCCITHDHFDHMDENSCIELADHVQLWIVPLGIKQWLLDLPATTNKIDPSQIVELEWWEQVHIEKRTDENIITAHRSVEGDDGDEIKNSSGTKSSYTTTTTITCCPSSHWCGRSLFDRNFRLWCSYAFSFNNDNNADSSKDTTTTRVFFSGDTGYPDHFPLFRQIGDALGPFDFAAIPIGAYKPTEMMKDAHCDPWEALRIHEDLRSKFSVGIHWGTFALSEENFDEPPQDLHQAIVDAAPDILDSEDGYQEGRLQTPVVLKAKPSSSSASLVYDEPVLESFTTLEHGQSIEVCTTGQKLEEEDAAVATAAAL